MSWLNKQNLLDKPYIHCISFSLGGGGSSSSSGSATTSTIDSEKKEDQTTTGSQVGTTTTTGTQEQTSTTTATGEKTTDLTEEDVISLLDEDTQNLLKDMIAEISTGDTGSDELVDLLESRALEADDAFAELVDPQVEEARRQAEIELGQQVQSLSRATGGTAGSNTLVAGYDLEGQLALESSIASLAATLGIDAREAATAEISGAIAAGLETDQQQVSSVAALADVLKGATQTGVKTIAEKETSQEIEEVVSALQSATTEEEVVSILEQLTGVTELTGTETSQTNTVSHEKGGGFGFSF